MDILTPILLALWDSRRNEEFMYKHGRRLIEESKQYTEEEMEPLKGREIDYMIKALEILSDDINTSNELIEKIKEQYKNLNIF